MAEDVLIQVSFPNVGSKQKSKNEHTEYYGIFLLFWLCSLVSPFFDKGKKFSDNSNLTKLFDIQC